MRRNVLSCLLLFSASPFDEFAYGVRGLICTLYNLQKCVDSQLMFSFPIAVAKISAIPNLTIEWSNNTFNA